VVDWSRTAQTQVFCKDPQSLRGSEDDENHTKSGRRQEEFSPARRQHPARRGTRGGRGSGSRDRGRRDKNLHSNNLGPGTDTLGSSRRGHRPGEPRRGRAPARHPVGRKELKAHTHPPPCRRRTETLKCPNQGVASNQDRATEHGGHRALDDIPHAMKPPTRCIGEVRDDVTRTPCGRRLGADLARPRDTPVRADGRGPSRGSARPVEQLHATGANDSTSSRRATGLLSGQARRGVSPRKSPRGPLTTKRDSSSSGRTPG